MKIPIRSVPEWLAVLPGLAAGWWLATQVVSPSARGDHAPSTASHSGRHESIAARAETRGPATGKAPELRMSREKLSLLRNAQRDLLLDFDAFGEGAANRVDFAFEILRAVLDVTPGEESELRAELQRSADELREFERAHLTDVSVGPGRMSFRMSADGEFRKSLLARIAAAEQSILGEGRAAMFRAITRTSAFLAMDPDFDGAVSISLEAGGTQLHIRDGHQESIQFFESGSRVPLDQDFGKFGYLIGPEARRVFSSQGTGD